MAGLKRIAGRVGGIRGDDGGIKMLARVGIAVTCSAVAFTVSYLTTRGGSSSGEEEEEEEEDDNSDPEALDTTTIPAAAAAAVELPQILPSEGTEFEDNVHEIELQEDELSQSVEDDESDVLEDDSEVVALVEAPRQQQSLEEEKEQQQRHRLKTAPLPLAAQSLDGRDDEEFSLMQLLETNGKGFNPEEPDVFNPDSEGKPAVQEAPGARRVSSDTQLQDGEEDESNELLDTTDLQSLEDSKTGSSWWIHNFGSRDTPSTLEAYGEEENLPAMSNATFGKKKKEKNSIVSGRKSEPGRGGFKADQNLSTAKAAAGAAGAAAEKSSSAASVPAREPEDYDPERRNDGNGIVTIDAAEFEALRSTVHKLRETETQLQGQILQYKGLAEAQACAIKDLLEKEKRIAEKLVKYRESSKRLGREREKSLHDREQEVHEKDVEIMELRSQFESLDSSDQIMNQASEISVGENLKRELDEAHARVEELQKEIETNADQANAELSMMKQKVSMLETQCEEDGSMIVELRSHLEAVELQQMNEAAKISSSENVKKELDEACARVEELEKEMETNAEQANVELSMMKQKVSMLETQCEEEGSMIVELRSHLEAVELQQMNEAAKISSSENVKKELDEASARVEELEKEIETNAEQANVELLMMKQKVSMLETQCEELHEKDAEIAELRSHLEVVELQLTNQALKISASEKLEKELKDAHAKVGDLEKEMQTNGEQANIELSKMKQKVSTFETQCEELQKKDVVIVELRSHLEAVELQNMNQGLEISASETLKNELKEAHVKVEELQKEMQTSGEQANVELSMMKQNVSNLETQCEELHKKDVEIMQLKSHLEVVELERKNEALEISVVEKLRKDLGEANARVEELQKEVQTNAKQADVELSMMKQKVSTLETQCEELKTEDVEIIQLRSRLEGLELENRNQALEISTSEKLKTELKDAHARVEELQQEMQTNAKEANVELSIMKQKVSMLGTQCEELHEKDVEIVGLRSQLEAVELQQLNQALEISASEKLKKELEDAHARVEELQKEMQTNAEQANAELLMAKQKVSTLETQCEELQNKDVEIKELKSHLEAIELKNTNQALEISTNEELKKEVEEAHGRVEELQKEMETNMEQANVELAMMKQKVSTLEMQCQELHEKDVEITKLRSHLEGLELQNTNQTLEISASKILKSDLDEAHTKVEELQKEMQRIVEGTNAELLMAKEKLSILETQHEEKGRKIMELQSHLETLTLQNMNQALEISSSHKLKKDLDEANARVEELQKEVEANVKHANVELSMMKQKVSMLETKCEELHEKDVEIMELRSHLKDVELHQKNQALEISMGKELKKELDDAHVRVEKLQKEIETNAEQANVELSMTKQKVIMLESECEEARSKNMDLRSHLEGFELENKTQALEISANKNLRKELKDAHARVEQLQIEMETNARQANVELSMTKKKVSTLETTSEEEQSKVKQLKSHLENLELENKNQTFEISTGKNLIKELEEAHHAKVEELQNEIQKNAEEANAKLSTMKHKVSMLETQCQELHENNVEIMELRSQLDSIKLQQNLKKELDETHARVKELQKEIQINKEQATVETLMMKEKVSMLETQCEEEISTNDLDIESKVHLIQEMEGKVVGLRQTNKELMEQRKELTERLSAMEIEFSHQQKMVVEEDHEVKLEEKNMITFQHVNEDLIKQVEGLQNSRFSEVEELVYLRWVNACLRHELYSHQTTLAKVSTLDLNKSSSLESVEKAKQLMLEYVNEVHTEIGHESSSSDKSLIFFESVGEDNDVSSISGHIRRKQNLIHRLRNWTARHIEVKSDVSASPVSPLDSERSFHFDPKRRQQSITRTKVPKETTTHIRQHASDTTLSNAVSMPMGGRKFDANVTKTSYSSPRRTASDSFVTNGASPKSDHVSSILEKPNLPTLETTITEDDDNPLDGSIANTTFHPMARSLAFKIGEKLSIKDRHIEALVREKEIKEKVKAERDRIRKENMRIENVVELPSTPQQLEGMSPAQVERVGSKIMPKPPPRPSRQMQQHSETYPLLLHHIPTTPSPSHFEENFGSLQPETKNDNMQKAPEVVELYMSLMKHEDAKKDENLFPKNNIETTHDDIINEIDDRSTHRLAIKADVEALGEFVQALAMEVRVAIYYNIDDVLVFVNWLDEELSLLVDETKVLKHFDWPKGKVDALQEAAFEYLDLMKLQEELFLFEDTPQLPCEKMLNKMSTLLERVELSVNGFLRTRDMEVARYKKFHIPIEWMLDSGVVGKIKQECVKLARVYINKVLSEVDHVKESAHKEPMQEFLLLQGVRFAFHVHQFAGGFDSESMKVFEALRDRAHVRSINSQ